MRSLNSLLNTAITRPTPIIERIVPSPRPRSICPVKNPIKNVVQTLNISKQFLQKPTPLPVLPLSLVVSLIACTIPSPGLGIILIFSDIAAPIPVNNTASSNTTICNTMLLCTDGIRAENTFKKRARHDEVVHICEDKNIHFLRHDMPYRNEMVRLGVTRILSDNASSGNLQPQGILFLPSDQPLITRTSLQLLCLTFLYYDDKICRLSYNENAGSPCIFPAKYYDELLNLPEKKGGGFLTKKYPAQVVLVPVRDEYELYDIDTPDDITRLLKFLHYPVCS